jgi:hypothetical protein
MVRNNYIFINIVLYNLESIINHKKNWINFHMMKKSNRKELNWEQTEKLVTLALEENPWNY